jgi:hypothetical protein
MSAPISVKVSGEGVFLNPDLDQQSYSPSILGKWWTRSSLILPGLGGFSRKEIVLGLADKEGGAHLDIDLPHRYRQLMESQQLQIGWNKESVSPLNLSRFMTARIARLSEAKLPLSSCELQGHLRETWSSHFPAAPTLYVLFA